MPAQVLQLTPHSELQFQGPFDDGPVTSLLRLRNPSSACPIAFRVKTTVPKSYCVRPNSGIVLPQGEVLVTITLQPVASDQIGAGSVRHRFMIQSLVVKATTPDASAADASGGCLEDLWNSASPFEVMNSRLTVTMIPAKSPIVSDQEEGNCGDERPVVMSDVPPQQQQQQPPQQPQQQQEQQQNLNDSNSELRRLQRELWRLQRENARLCEQELQLRMSAVKIARKSRYSLNRRSSWQGLPWQLQDDASNIQAALVSIGSFLLALVAGLAIGKLCLQN